MDVVIARTRHAKHAFPRAGSDQPVAVKETASEPTHSAPCIADRFRDLQSRLGPMFRDLFRSPNAPRTVVVIPSLSLEERTLARLTGGHLYEERMLCLLLLLRLPRTTLLYATSQPIPEQIVDYYLHLLPGIPAQHARRRLTLFSCHDGSAAPLTAKILARPRMLRRLSEAIPDRTTAHMTCFNVTELERALAVRLGVPIYGCDPELRYWGSKSGSRKIFRAAGIPLPLGFEDLTTADDLARALAELKGRAPEMRRAMVKLNEGSSGDGNALFDLRGAPHSGLSAWVRERLPTLTFEAKDMTWRLFDRELGRVGCIVEEFIEGADKRSPSSQFRIDPLGGIEPISTHDQLLGGKNGQTYLGCRFPADDEYRLELQEKGARVARVLADKGAIGRFSVDFVSVKGGDGRHLYAVEINLRKGGTTHPFLMLQHLTDGHYERRRGLFLTPAGRPRYYYACDDLEAEHYRGLTPSDLIDIAAMNGLHFNAASQEGVTFHLIEALSQFGKLGVLCIGSSPDRAEALYRRTITVLDHETSGRES